MGLNLQTNNCLIGWVNVQKHQFLFPRVLNTRAHSKVRFTASLVVYMPTQPTPVDLPIKATYILAANVCRLSTVTLVL